MKKSSIRWDRKTYMEITIDDDNNISLKTINENGEISEYEVTPKTKNTRKTNK